MPPAHLNGVVLRHGNSHLLLLHVDGVRLSLNCSHHIAHTPNDIYISMESHSEMILTGEN
jgi:hypothetical protein